MLYFGMTSEVNTGMHSPWALSEKVLDSNTFRLVYFTSQKLPAATVKNRTL